MEDVYDAAIETLHQQEDNEAKQKCKTTADQVGKAFESERVDGNKRQLKVIDDESVYYATNNSIVMPPMEKGSKLSGQKGTIYNATGRSEVKSCIQVQASPKGTPAEDAGDVKTRNVFGQLDGENLNSRESQDKVTIVARQETQTSNEEQIKSQHAGGVTSTRALRVDVSLKQSKTALGRANARPSAHVHPKLVKNQKIHYEESKEEADNSTQRTARQKPAGTTEKRARPASLTFGQRGKSKDANALAGLLGGKLINKFLLRLEKDREGIVLFSPRNHRIFYGRSQEPTHVEFSERSTKSSRKTAQVTYSGKQRNQKSGKTKQATVIEKPPLGKVPKLKLDFVVNDKADRTPIMIAHNSDSKQDVDISIVTITEDGKHHAIGVNKSNLQSHELDAQTTRKKYSKRQELPVTRAIGDADLTPGVGHGFTYEQKQLSNISNYTGRQEVPGFSQEADARSKAMTNTDRNMLSKMAESEILPVSNYDPSAISNATTPQMLLRPKAYEAPQSPCQTIDLALQQISPAQRVQPDQDQTTILQPEINRLYSDTKNMDGTPTEEGEAQSLQIRLTSKQNESSMYTPSLRGEKELNEQPLAIQVSQDKILDITANSVVKSNKIERKSDKNDSYKSESQVRVEAGFKEFGQPVLIGKEMSATERDGDKIHTGDQKINDGRDSRDEAVSSLSRNTVGQQLQSAAIVATSIPQKGTEKDLTDDNEGVSVITARNSQRKFPQRTSIQKERNSNALNIEKESSDPFERAVDSMGTYRQGNEPALVESEASHHASHRESEEAGKPGAFNPDLGTSLALEKTERVEAKPAQAPAPRAAFDLTMAGPSLVLEQGPGLLSRPTIKSEEKVEEADPISIVEEKANDDQSAGDQSRELNLQTANEYVDQLQSTIEASADQKKAKLSLPPQGNGTINSKENEQAKQSKPIFNTQPRTQQSNGIIAAGVNKERSHDQTEDYNQEDSQNLALAIECVDGWAERIINRQRTQSQRNQQAERGSAQKNTKSEVVNVQESKKQEKQDVDQDIAKPSEVKDDPQAEEKIGQVCSNNVQVEDLESSRGTAGEIEAERSCEQAPAPIGKADVDLHFGSSIKLRVQDQESQASSLFQHIEADNMDKAGKEEANDGGNTNQVKNRDAESPRGKIKQKNMPLKNTTPPVESIREEDDGEDLDDDVPMNRGEYGRATACFKRPSNKSDQVQVRAQRPSRNTPAKSLTQTLEQKVIKDAIFTEEPDYVASSLGTSIKEKQDLDSAQEKVKKQEESGESPVIARRLSLGRTTGAPFRTSKVLSIAANCATLSVAGEMTDHRTVQRVKNRGQLSVGASHRDRKAGHPSQGGLWQDGSDDDQSPDAQMEQSEPTALKAVKIIKSSEMVDRARKVAKVPGSTGKMKLLKTKTAQQSQTVEELNLDLLMSKQKKKQTPVPMISFPNKVRRTSDQKKSLVSICNSLEQDIILFPGFDSARGKKYFKFLQPSQGSMKQARYPSAGAAPTKMMSRSKKKFFLAQQEAKKAEFTDRAGHKEEVKRPFIFTRPAEPHQRLFLDSPEPAVTSQQKYELQAPKLGSRALQQSTSASAFKPSSSHLRLTQYNNTQESGLSSTQKAKVLQEKPNMTPQTKQPSMTLTEPRLSKSAKFLKNPVYVYQSKKSQAQVDFEQEMKQTMQKFPNMRVELRYQEVDEAAEKLAARPPLLSKQHRGSPYNIKTKVSKPSTFQDDNKRRSAGLTSAAHLFGANSPMSSNSASSNKQQYPKFIKVKQKNKI